MGWDIPEAVTGILEKGFDQSTCLGVRHLIPMELFHDNQVLWQRLKARVGQWISQMEGVGKCKGTSLDHLDNLVGFISSSVPTDPQSPWS